MKNKRNEVSDDEISSSLLREEYYRVCIAEFQNLGYQEQYFNEVFNGSNKTDPAEGDPDNN